jgi:hypothetical protein
MNTDPPPPPEKPGVLPWWGNFIVTVVCAYVFTAVLTLLWPGFPAVLWKKPLLHLVICGIGIAGTKWWDEITNFMITVSDMLVQSRRRRW